MQLGQERVIQALRTTVPLNEGSLARLQGTWPNATHINKHNHSVEGTKNGTSPLQALDYVCFQTPNCKLVAKSLARLHHQDLKSGLRYDNLSKSIKTPTSKQCRIQQRTKHL
ncbi:hypothetical protein GJ744_012357 [Endocarpon pusillum]|uniref:Hydroxymethylglutaryl-coenzyme A synthase C-terminal domain-containing protein n=1 Tax=Endocarpon pusillum TaxID=364733 RepID=A0A8H7ABB9_9EURO|nr:hypothetical protein GJ744_012357 [Endocarpon pusillum]